jgi:murein DD-endopeptidase MepM/ murein hydrolase activator NlpD
VSINDLNGVASAAIQQANSPDVESIRKSANQEEAAIAFESYMVEMMVKEMRRSVPEGIFTSGAMDMFSGLFDQEISKRIAESGGLGFDKLIGNAMGVQAGANPEPSFQKLSKYRRPSAAIAAAPTGEMPVDGGVVTSKFGARRDPFHGRTRAHKGLDIAAPQGTPIQPIRPGTVVSAGKRGGFGNVVVLDHGDGTTSLYAHCHELKVQKGDTVQRGDVIATVGSTGRSTGPHLHLEVHQDGTAVDPMAELKHEHGQENEQEHKHVMVRR